MHREVNIQETDQKESHYLGRNLEDDSLGHQSRFRISMSYQMLYCVCSLECILPVSTMSIECTTKCCNIRTNFASVNTCYDKL